MNEDEEDLETDRSFKFTEQLDKGKMVDKISVKNTKTENFMFIAKQITKVQKDAE